MEPGAFDMALRALRRNLEQIHVRPMHWSNKATPNQRWLLKRLMEGALGEDRDLRMGVLGLILEAPIHHSSQILKWEAHTLIEFLIDKQNGGLSEHSRSFLEQARFIVSQSAEAGAHGAPGRPAQPNLPNLWQASWTE